MILNLKNLVMKKSISITFAVLGIIFLSSMILNDEPGWSSRKDGKDSKPIPSNVMKIFEESCVKCHTGGGNWWAEMHLNLSKWDKFSPGKQAYKAKRMCKKVSNGKMPPKGFREKHPDATPTKDEIKIICDWATSIKK